MTDDLDLRVRRSRLGVGWFGSFTDRRGDIIGVSPVHGWWRPTRRMILWTLRRKTNKEVCA